MSLQLTHRQAKALAKFINELRPDWDAPGIESQLSFARAKASAAELAIAAIRAASSGRNRTPAVIGMDGEHWRTGPGDAGVTGFRPARLAPHQRCSICNQGEARCRQLAALPDDGHEFSPDLPDDEPLVNRATGELLDVNAVVSQLRQALPERTSDAQPDESPDSQPEEHDACTQSTTTETTAPTPAAS